MSVYEGAATDVLDVDNTLIRFGGDKQLFIEMTSILLEDAPRLAAKLTTAVDSANANAVEMSAHALRGLVAGCGGVRTAEAAQKLEDAAHRADLDDAAAKLAAVNSELRSLLDAIRAYHRSNGSN